MLGAIKSPLVGILWGHTCAGTYSNLIVESADSLSNTHRKKTSRLGKDMLDISFDNTVLGKNVNYKMLISIPLFKNFSFKKGKALTSQLFVNYLF